MSNKINKNVHNNALYPKTQALHYSTPTLRGVIYHSKNFERNFEPMLALLRDRKKDAASNQKAWKEN